MTTVTVAMTIAVMAMVTETMVIMIMVTETMAIMVTEIMATEMVTNDHANECHSKSSSYVEFNLLLS